MSLTGYSLNYNDTPLDMIHANVIGRDHIYTDDGVTYLYTRWIFDGLFVYNPQAISFDVGGNPNPGRLPTETDFNIRETLRVNRATLIFTVGNDVMLVSPDGVNETDAKNGPIVERCNIIKTMGVKTFYIDLRIVTHVNECPNSGTQFPVSAGAGHPSPILSHRWKRIETADDDYFSTIITEGTVIFRSDVLQRIARNPGLVNAGWPAFPDQFRRNLFHPIPNFFKRGPIEVMPHEDGITYSYRVTDSQKSVHGPSGPTSQNCTRVQLFHTSWYTEGDLFNQIGNAATGVLHMAFLTAFNAGYKRHVMARVWGNFYSNRMHLQNVGVAAAVGLIGQSNTMFSTEFFISHDVTGKFVQVELTHHSGKGRTGQQDNDVDLYDKGQGFVFVADENIGESGLVRVAAAFAKTDSLQETVFASDMWNGTKRNFTPVVGRDSPTPGGSPIPAPPNSNGTRGTWIGNLLAAALSEACGQPTAPPAKSFSPSIDIPLLNPPRDIVQERIL